MITNAKKTLHPGKFIATFLMGTRALYDFADHNPDVEMHPVEYVNHPAVIALNDNMVSINSCTQVDLMGQVAAEMIGYKQISGVGGQVDFVRGSALSKNGRSIIAMPSTAAKGAVSRIVALLDQFDTAQNTRETKRIQTGREIGVRLLYWTAFVDGQGRVAFREDVYNRDRRLAQALGIAVNLPAPVDDGRTDANDVGP